MNTGFAKFRSKITNPVSYRLFLLARLPLVYFTGIKIKTLDEDGCTTVAKYSWLNQNPFRSMYFAVMNMAAELSTGVLCMGNIYEQKPAVSMLVVRTEAEYYKKATGKISFTCNDGSLIAATIGQAKETGEPYTIKCTSTAINEAGETVAMFWITWSIRAKGS